MSRSIWKLVNRSNNFERRRLSETGTIILPRYAKLNVDLLGQNLFIHNGRRLINFNAMPEHLGCVAGEFVPTHIKPKITRKKILKKNVKA